MPSLADLLRSPLPPERPANTGVLADLLRRADSAHARNQAANPGGMEGPTFAAADKRGALQKLADALMGGVVSPQGWKDYSAQQPTKPQYSEELVSNLLNVITPMGIGATVFHGSPYKFDKFDASKIGTGEGAQAYGHGLYFAENPSVAKSYMGGKSGFISEPVIGGKQISELPKELLRKWEMKSGGTSYGMIDELRKVADPSATLSFYKNGGGPLAEIAKEIESLGISNAKATNLYKADIPDAMIPKMLDWDKPLSQQSAEVRGVLDKLKQASGKPNRFFDPFAGREMNGSQLHKALVTELGDDGAARVMAEAGIPGIRYLDQGSRGTGGGTYNYVVFPGMEKEVKILGRE